MCLSYAASAELKQREKHILALGDGDVSSSQACFVDSKEGSKKSEAGISQHEAKMVLRGLSIWLQKMPQITIPFTHQKGLFWDFFFYFHKVPEWKPHIIYYYYLFAVTWSTR